MIVGKLIFNTSYDLAVWLHENYERIAADENWQTQKVSRVSFDDLPDANKQTMLRLAETIFIGK